jgi:citrate lyase subunit beta/citryl-CoA lyase
MREGAANGRPALGMAPIRTMLFAPANSERKLRKLQSLPADAVVLDLEDTVPPEEKADAANHAGETLSALAAPGLVGVRINAASSPRWDADLEAVVKPGLDFVVAPMTESTVQLLLLDGRIAELEQERGLPTGRIGLIASIETAAAVTACEEIAAQAPPRLATLAFGPVDLSADLSIDLEESDAIMTYARSRMVIACRAGRRRAPIDGPYLAISDLDGLRRTTLASRRFGFQGRVAIHPDQLLPINDVFSAAPAELDLAGRIVTAFEHAEREGTASITVDGRFVDYPVYAAARQKLAAAHRQAPTGETRGD